MKVIGFYLSAVDNDSYMNSSLYEVNICNCLQIVRNRETYIAQDFKLNKKQYDISYTYDSYLIVSNKFRKFCIDKGYNSLMFSKIPGNEKHYVMTVDTIKHFDSKRRETKFLDYNPSCHEYNEVVGASPVCLIDNTVLEDKFYRTDIEFGRGYSKSPLILIGNETAQKLKFQKFKGLEIEEIYDKYEWER